LLGTPHFAIPDLGRWEPFTNTETTQSLVGRRPFAWWLLLIVIFVFPSFGVILYLFFWPATSKATVFLHTECDELLVGTGKMRQTRMAIT